MKMYICIKDNVPDELVPAIAAHASLACYLKFKDDACMQDWLKNSFKKAVTVVNDKEWQKASKSINHVVMIESSLGGIEVALAFAPRSEWPNVFKFMKLWKPKSSIERES